MGVILQVLSRFGAARLAAMGAVTLALVGFFAFVILRVSQPAMGVLFSELTPTDMSAVSRDLDGRGVRYEVRDDGQTILVPKADLSRLRMELAGKGLPSGGGVGYEIFDKGDAFSSTSFVQGINQLRALEGELARTIRSLARVQSARVHLAVPERRLFERDREPPRASIVLKLRGELPAEQVQAIRHLAATAVQGLSPDRISIVDERGRLLADGAGDSDGVSGTAAEDKRSALERRLRARVEEIVSGAVGPGRSRVQVSAELEQSRVESRSETYDPEGRVLRSSQTRGETASTSTNEGQVSVGSELPGARDNPAASAGPKDASSKTEEVSNYEISRTTRTEVLAAGRLKRLSVAVLVDGVRAADGSYKARTPEELDRIGTLVRSAVGFDSGRGDVVEVVNLPLAEAAAPTAGEAESLLGSLLVRPSREDVMRFVELGVIALLVLLVLLTVVRPMVRRVLAPDAVAVGTGSTAALVGTGPAPAGAEAGAGAVASAAPPAIAAQIGAPVLDASRLDRLGEMARANPREAAAVLRAWMAER